LQLHPTSLGYVTIRYYPTCTVPDPVPEGAGATHLVGARALGDAAGVHEDLHGRRGALGPAPRGKGLAQGSKLRFAVGGFAGGAQGPAAMMPPPPPRTPVSPTWVPLFSVAAPKGLQSCRVRQRPQWSFISPSAVMHLAPRHAGGTPSARRAGRGDGSHGP
jgi:hypothetical protein